MNPGRAILVIVGLLIAYAVMARTASNATSATYDEPLHLVSAYVIRHGGDFRMNPEDPPLFQRWLGLALPASALAPDYTAAEWNDVRTNLAAHWAWVNRTLYPHPSSLPPGVHVDHRQVLADARAMMLLVALALGAVSAALAWTIASVRARSMPGSDPERLRWAAAVAGILAAVLFAFDPSLLGHGPLVKNDVALSLSFTLVALALVLLGERITWGRVMLLAFSAGIGVATKFSGLLLAPFIVTILVVRACLPWAWHVGSRELRTAPRRLLAAGGISVACLLTGVLMIWAVYGFRYGFSPDPALRADLVPEIMMTKTHVARAANPSVNPVPEVVDATPLPMPVRLALLLNDHRLLPEAWAKGFVYTYGTTLLRATFLMGEISELGWWYYFPAVLAFKLPLGTIALLILTAVAGLRAWKRGPPSPPPVRWAMLAPGLLAFGYFAVAVSGNMNLGIRHLLPMIPAVFAMAAATLAPRLVSGSRPFRYAVAVLLCGLAAESAASHHRYIAFFNLPARLYGPEKLLTDSNLDWGQDLPALADWQARNPGTTLSLAYFGLATPESHGIRYKPLTGTPFSWERATPNPAPGPGVVAISATWLQEVYMTPSSRGIFSLFRHLKPIDTINGTIFLYNWPPTRADLADEPMRLYWRAGDKVEEVPLRSALPRR